MKIFKSKAGQMRVIESILASFILVSAITFVSTFAVTPQSSTYEVGALEKLGHNALHGLDEEKLLSGFVYNQSEWSSNFTAALRISLPSDVYFDLRMSDLNGTLLNPNIPIRYGDPEVFNNSDSIASVTYCIAGYSRFDSTKGSEVKYEPRTLILLLVRE